METVRNADLDTLVGVLRDQHTRKLDAVVPSSKLSAAGGQIFITGADPVIEDDGVTDPNGQYLPTRVADDGLARVFNVPAGYFRRLRETNITAWDHTVDDWLGHDEYASRKYLLRTFRGQDSDVAVLRAVLTDSYGMIDHLDSLLATLEGINEAGVQVQVDQCDLSDSRMRVTFVSEQVRVMAPALLENYRSPFGGASPLRRAGNWTLRSGLAAAQREGLGFDGGDEPVLWAGFCITNSEVGLGRYVISPRLVVQICRNGLTITDESISRQHLGAKLDEGAITPSRRTQTKLLELITSQTADAVTKFLDPDWVAGQARKLEAQAGAPVTDADETIKVITKKLNYDESQQKTILDAFIRGGQLTAAGVMNAFTAVAQVVDSPDEAHRLESDALRAMALVSVE